MFDKIISFIFSILLHALIVVLLFFGIERIYTYLIGDNSVKETSPILVTQEPMEDTSNSKVEDQTGISTTQPKNLYSQTLVLAELEEDKQKRLTEAQQKLASEKVKLLEEKRKAEEALKRLDEEKRQARIEAERLAEEKRKLEVAKKLAEKQHQVEAKRLAAEKRRLEEEKQLVEKKRQAEIQRLAEEKQRSERQKQLAEQKRQAEEKNRLVAEKRRKQEIAEKKRQSELARKKELERKRLENQRLAEQKRLDAERQKQEQARLAKEAERKQQAVAAEQRRREQARLAQEVAARRVANAKQQKIARVAAQIKALVESRWQRPANISNDLTCLIQIRLIPDGSVGSANIISSSGNSAFDSSAITAVQNASPFQIPKDVFNEFRLFNFKFTPQ